MTLKEAEDTLAGGTMTPKALETYEYYHGESWYKSNEDDLSASAKSCITSIQRYQAQTGDRNLSEMHKNLLTRATEKGNITDAELGYILDKFHWR